MQKISNQNQLIIDLSFLEEAKNFISLETKGKIKMAAILNKTWIKCQIYYSWHLHKYQLSILI